MFANVCRFACYSEINILHERVRKSFCWQKQRRIHKELLKERKSEGNIILALIKFAINGTIIKNYDFISYPWKLALINGSLSPLRPLIIRSFSTSFSLSLSCRLYAISFSKPSTNASSSSSLSRNNKN